MRAKFIYEKFTDESDPIKDLGIGIKTQYEEWVEKNVYKSSYGAHEDKFYNTEAFIDTVKARQHNFVKYLLSCGISPDKEDTHHEAGTALRWAVTNNDIEMLTILINAGGDPNYTNRRKFLQTNFNNHNINDKTKKFCFKEIRKWNSINKNKK